jgi:hypothetical protein
VHRLFLIIHLSSPLISTPQRVKPLQNLTETDKFSLRLSWQISPCSGLQALPQMKIPFLSGKLSEKTASSLKEKVLDRRLFSMAHLLLERS